MVATDYPEATAIGLSVAQRVGGLNVSLANPIRALVSLVELSGDGRGRAHGDALMAARAALSRCRDVAAVAGVAPDGL
jgi:hypothetical protein